MGLFGDRKLKKLNEEIDLLWVALRISKKTHESAQAAERGTQLVLGAARLLAADGRRNLAIERLRAGRRSEQGAVEELGNQVLESVIRQL